MIFRLNLRNSSKLDHTIQELNVHGDGNSFEKRLRSRSFEMRSTSRDKENSSATLSTIIDLGITPPPKFIRETRPQLFDKLAIRMAASLPSREKERREGKGREGPRELLKRYYARHTLSRNQQFQFGLLDLVVRDTLTQLRTEREREREEERKEKRERERERAGCPGCACARQL